MPYFLYFLYALFFKFFILSKNLTKINNFTIRSHPPGNEIAKGSNIIELNEI